ncbi:hypothetical protein KUTeg_015800 [Tegillarca granosa]|uniref:DDE-1 domain-containing protein n=1 Tax=Tegillarca granosa TaxID=220873 RepID=A0ABQ9EJ86_TEGGR|nr:hypothetical protein KUTeg_015800 [Tegillarca granosa]
MEIGPSHKWFRNFYKRHSKLKEGQAETQDRGRSRMANIRVMDQYFTLLKETLDRLNLKPSQIFNCDETGWSGKEKSRQKVTGIKGQHSYQQACFTPTHITANLCICADGRILPTFLIFESGLPHTAYTDGVPESLMFGYFASGYMDHCLFQSWFEYVFIPYCGSARPVLLIMDNNDSHITLDTINIAFKNQIELLCLPPHTTHILQPQDVHINGPLKARVASVATMLNAFGKTGISPFDADAIDKTQLVESHSATINKFETLVKSSSEDLTPSTSSSTLAYAENNTSTDKSICITCGTFLGGNPLVTEGLIPQQLADIFQPIPCNLLL